VERYLRDNFGGAGSARKSSWYDHVVEVDVSGATTTIRTDLSRNRSTVRLAGQICMAVRGSIAGSTDSVRVITLTGGTLLAECVP
jgi:hypothetical protein